MKEKLKLLKDVFGSSQPSNKEHLFLCPIIGCSSLDKNKKKLSINIEKNKFKCWVCDYHGSSISHLIKRFGTLEQIFEWSRLSGEINFAEKEDIKSLLINPKDEEKEEIIFNLPEEFISLVGNYDTSTQRARNYLLSRGVEEIDIIKWRIGFALGGEYENRIIIPSFNKDGKINYFVSRSFGNDYMKYKNPPVNKGIVFNHLLIDWRMPIVLCEGVFDCIVAGDNSIPLLGSTLTENSTIFQEIVKNNTIIYLALDPDAKVKEMDLMKKLLLYGIEVYKINIQPYHDVGEMNKNELTKRKESAIIINNERFALYKLLNA